MVLSAPSERRSLVDWNAHSQSTVSVSYRHKFLFSEVWLCANQTSHNSRHLCGRGPVSFRDVTSRMQDVCSKSVLCPSHQLKTPSAHGLFSHLSQQCGRSGAQCLQFEPALQIAPRPACFDQRLPGCVLGTCWTHCTLRSRFSLHPLQDVIQTAVSFFATFDHVLRARSTGVQHSSDMRVRVPCTRTARRLRPDPTCLIA